MGVGLKLLLPLFGVYAAAFASSSAFAQESFYQGKRLTLLINFAPGGPTDIEGRLLARHVGKHIPGKPAIIVQNMDGAGGAVGTNYLGEVAPKDGTYFGYLTGPAWRYVSVKEKSRVDFLTYNVVAYQPGTTVYYVRTDIAPGIRSASDILKAREVVIGGLAADSSKDLLQRLTMDLLGVKYRYVTGYKGNAGARLALQRGEISMFAESPPGYRSIVEPGIVAKGEAVPLFYDPGWNGTRYAEPAQVKGLPMKPFHEFYREVKGHEPSGKAWEIYRHILAINGAMQRMVVFPPGVPKAAMDAVREGIRQLETDKEFAADAEKSVGFVPDYEASENVQDLVRKALSVPAEDKEWIENYIRNAPR
jgi:tripartite-type tricarboxylate transporter receptor subunit TctC